MENHREEYAQDLDCSYEEDKSARTRLALVLRKCGPDLYVRDKSSSLGNTLVDCAAFHSRTIHILSTIPQNKILRPENDLIIGCRDSAVQIITPRGFTSSNERPASHFDPNDCVFFSTIHAKYTWCSLRVDGDVTVGRKIILVTCYFACLYWNKIPTPEISISSALLEYNTTFRTEFAIRFESQLESLEHASHVRVPLVFYHELRSALQNEHLGSIASPHVSHTARMTYTINRALLPEICKIEMHLVRMSF